MREVMKTFFDIMNGPYVQAILAVTDIYSLVSAICKKENRKNLETEVIYCFDCALHSFCQEFELEYDQKAIWETFTAKMEILQNIEMENLLYDILKKALGISELTSAQKKYWSYAIPKVIAEEELNVLSSFLATKNLMFQNRSDIPRILTELAPRPPEKRNIVLRETEQEKILKTIENERKLVLVNGLGGVGKSTVCKELFYHLYENDTRKLAWVTYNGKDLSEDFIEQFYYPKLQTERRERISFFLQTEIDADAIVFVDNLNVRDIDDRFITSLQKARCCVVCTSRITDYAHFVTIPIEFFSVNQCVQLFKNYANIQATDTSQDDCIKEIVNKVGRHTLTIEILGKISEAEGFGPSEILQQLKDKGIDLTDIVEVDLKEDTLVGHLCRIFPTDKLNDTHKYILTHLAHCTLEQIPKQIREWIGIENKHNFRYLKKYGWFTEDDKSYYMHPIIKEVVKRICVLKSRDDTVLIKNLQKLTTFNRNKSMFHVMQYYPYIEGVLERNREVVSPELAWLCFNFAVLTQENKNFERAIVLHLRALSIWENPQMLNMENESYINTRRANIQTQIGANFFYMNDCKSAREWYDKAYQIRNTHTDKELNVQLYSNYALTYQKDYKNGNLKNQRLLLKALDYFKRTVSGFQKMNKVDEFAAIAYRNIGELYFDMREFDQSIYYFEKALDIREGILSPDAPNREKNYYDLARAFDLLSKEKNTTSGKMAKSWIANYYYGLCYDICRVNAKKKENMINLEKLERQMQKSEEKYQELRNRSRLR